MKSVEEYVREYLSKIQIMQLGTAANNQPWICTVHFYQDENLNFYWCSDDSRRHSKELEQNPKAAAYFLIHENTPEEDYVIGISLEGSAQRVKGSENKDAVEGYVKKLGKDEATRDKLLSDSKPFYRFTPSKIVLFNNKDFPDNARQEWNIN